MRFLNWGYGYFCVEEIPDSLTTPGNIIHYFRPIHVPADQNYSHSEIRTFKEQEMEPATRINNPKTNLEFRLALRNRIKILEEGSETQVKQ